jgi:hypothetical protein
VVERIRVDDLLLTVESPEFPGRALRFRLGQLASRDLSLAAGVLGVGGFSLERPELDVNRDWLARVGAASALEGPGGPVEPSAEKRGGIAIDASDIRVNGGRLVVEAQHGQVEAGVRLSVDRFVMERAGQSEIELEWQFGEGRVSLNGALGFAPLSFEGTLHWDRLTVPPVTALVVPELLPWLTSCDARGALEVSYRSEAGEEPAGTRLSGDMSVSDLAFSHPETGELELGWEQLDIGLSEAFIPALGGGPLSFTLSELRIAKPKGRFTSPPDALDELLAILSEGLGAGSDEEESGDATPADADAGLAFSSSVDALSVEDGAFELVERSVQPPHSTKIHGLDVTARSIRLHERSFDALELAAVVQDAAIFSVTGELSSEAGAFDVALEHLDLVSFDPFARRLGFAIESGEGSLVSKVEIAGNDVWADNELVLHHLDLQFEDPDRSVSVFGTSAELALALLRDPNGEIDLDVPVHWNPESAGGVSLARVMGDAVQDALTGALMMPLKLVGSALPGHGEVPALDPIGFDPGESGLSPTAEARVRRLGTLLVSRPGLRVELQGQTSHEDRRALSLLHLTEIIAVGDRLPEELIEEDRERLETALRRMIEAGAPARPSDEPVIIRASDHYPLDEGELVQLADARSAGVRVLLLEEGVPDTAIATRGTSTGGTSSVALALGVRR